MLKDTVNVIEDVEGIPDVTLDRGLVRTGGCKEAMDFSFLEQ